MEIQVRQAEPEDTDAVSSILLEAAGWLESRGIQMWRADELSPDQISQGVRDGPELRRQPSVWIFLTHSIRSARSFVTFPTTSAIQSSFGIYRATSLAATAFERVLERSLRCGIGRFKRRGQPIILPEVNKLRGKRGTGVCGAALHPIAPTDGFDPMTEVLSAHHTGRFPQLPHQ